MDVIDLSKLQTNKKKLLTICEEKGCFRIINHGISREMQLEMKEAVENYFNLPESARLHFKKLTNTRCLDSNSAQMELTPVLETFTLKNTALADEVDALCSQLQLLSPQHRYIMRTYALEVHKLATSIACKIADSLDYEHSFDGWSGLLRPNKYDFDEESLGSVGVITHTDSGFLTILQEDELIGGLEIMDNKSGSYLAVDPAPGSFVVFLGDVAKAWSNGRLHNVKHRVVCREVGLRITIPLFITAPNEGIVESPEAFVDGDHPRLYKAFTYQDYRDIIVYEQCYAGEALTRVLIT